LTQVKPVILYSRYLENILEAIMNGFPVLRFAVAAGLFLSLHAVIVTISAMAGIPGMRPFAELLTQFYGSYGYSISGTGIIVGALLGFSEGFVHLGIFGLIYKWLPISR
jgi:hypothetical protein